MSPRRYRLERRAETAGETRRRLVDATFALHVEQGISATTMTDIAGRAGVSVGTVYHHFPTYQDAVAACNVHLDEILPLPAADIFNRVTEMHDRDLLLVLDIIRFYQRLPDYERVRCERWGMPPLEAYAAREEDNRLALTREALRPFRIGARLPRVCAALLDVAVYGALTRAGMTPGEAADEVSAVILARLATPAP
jgi:AcrR family transcriptional regulator